MRPPESAHVSADTTVGLGRGSWKASTARASDGAHRATLATVAVLVRLAFLVIAKLKISDADVRPAAGHGLIVAINHRSMLDILVATIACQQWGLSPHTLARGDFFARPVLGRALTLLGAIPAGRGRGAAVTLTKAREILHGGGAIIIAPEGRIVAADERPDGLGELRGGIGVMSSRHGTPILLTAIRNTDTAWPVGRRTPVLCLPWNRPTITVAVTWMEVPAGTPPSSVTGQVAEGLRTILGTAERTQGHV